MWCGLVVCLPDTPKGILNLWEEEFRIIGTVFWWAGLTLESISREHIVKSWKRCGLKQGFDVIDADTGEADDSDTESLWSGCSSRTRPTGATQRLTWSGRRKCSIPSLKSAAATVTTFQRNQLCYWLMITPPRIQLLRASALSAFSYFFISFPSFSSFLFFFVFLSSFLFVLFPVSRVKMTFPCHKFCISFDCISFMATIIYGNNIF